MGAWSHTSFGNDDAMDFLYEAERDAMGAVRHAIEFIESIPRNGYVDAPDAAMLLAAGELLAAANGHARRDEFPPEAAAIARTMKPDAHLRLRAASAITRILDASELRSLWEEGDGFDIWRADVTGLIARLQ